MRKSLSSTLAIVLSLGGASTASAEILLADFENNSAGPLSGQAAQTGQVWGDFTLFGGPLGMDVVAATGVGGTNGAGTGSFLGNTTSLGTTLTTGVYFLEMDWLLTATAINGPQYWLSDSVNGTNSSLQWFDPGGASTTSHEGLGSFQNAGGSGLTGPGDQMHIRHEIDLDAKTFSWSWYALNDPDNVAKQGSSGPHSYTVDFQPDTLHIYWNASGGTGTFDSIVLDAVSALAGDLNSDGFVGQDDLNIILGNWGQMPPADPRADPSGDGFVGQDDLNPVLGDWGQGTPPAALSAVPEPHAVLLLGLGAMTAVPLVGGRRRRQ